MLVRAEDGSAPTQATELRAAWNDEALWLRFDCDDSAPWATRRGRDEPLYEEEVVELFLAAGAEDPANYFEFEINPLGALFDARIENPGLDRRALRADTSWDCPGAIWQAELRPGGWRAALALPWRGLELPAAPLCLRANFYRIDRPLDRAPEHSAWSPTGIVPADFHRPRRFGLLRLAAPGR